MLDYWKYFRFCHAYLNVNKREKVPHCLHELRTKSTGEKGNQKNHAIQLNCLILFGIEEVGTEQLEVIIANC